MFTRLEIAVSNGNRVVLDFSKPEEEIVATLVSAIERPVKDLAFGRFGWGEGGFAIRADGTWIEQGRDYGELFSVDISPKLCIPLAVRSRQAFLMREFFPENLFLKAVVEGGELTKDERNTVRDLLNTHKERIEAAREQALVDTLPVIALFILDLCEGERLQRSQNFKASCRIVEFMRW